MTNLSFQELMEAFMAICPQGEMEEDLNGQVLFYTGLRKTAEGKMETFPDEEER